MSGPEAQAPQDHAQIRRSLAGMRLLRPGEPVRFVPLSGGVSSEILRVETAGGRFCVKRALPVLKVAQRWEAPVARNRHEADYFDVVGAFAPAAVPRLLGRDSEGAIFAMEWLAPETHRLWKTELLAGTADAAVARAVGAVLASIHARTASTPGLPERFATDPVFHALRLEPYLEATARVHPDRAAALTGLSRRTAATRRALVHGDVSPKNILVGPQGPVFLDAECAWFGDPAFDLAFCLNHLLLKAVHRREGAGGYLATFAALATAYLEGVDWEPPAEVERRAATLLPGLGLARVDGKSPVEYLGEDERDLVRRVTRALLERPSDTLDGVADAWREALSQ